MDPLSKQVLEANEAHKNALDQYISKLQVELNAVDKLIAAVEELPGDEDQEDPGDSWCLHAAGAFKPTSIIDLSDAVLEKSPFHEEAVKTNRYKKSVIPDPFSNSEKRYLEKAVTKENTRLAAIRAQQSGQDPFAAAVSNNEFLITNTEDIDWVSVARSVSGLNYPLSGRTPQECKVRWIGTQGPKINTQEWPPNEETRLRDLVEVKRDSGIDWEEIAKLLDTNRSPLDCIKRFQASNRSTFQWTPVLDQKLLDAVQKHGNNNWALVATSVSLDVSANQCQIRYGRSVNPRIKRGKFSAAEDMLLMKAVEAHGSDWIKVSQAVPGRTNAQCRERYKHHLTGGIVKAPWEEEEDTRLKEAVNKHGHKWDKVHEEMGCIRQRTEYATRYRILAKWAARGNANQTEVGGSGPPQPRPGSNSDLVAVSPSASAATSQVGDTENGGNVASTSQTESTPHAPPSQLVHARTPKKGSAAAKPSKGKGSTRGRKRKLPDTSLEVETSNVADQASTNTSTSRKRPKPRPSGAMAAAHQTRAAAMEQAQASTPNSGGINLESISHDNPAPDELAVSNASREADMTEARGKTPPTTSPTQPTADLLADPEELSDLTDLGDLVPPKTKTRWTKAAGIAPVTSVADTSVTSTGKPKKRIDNSAVGTSPKPTPRRTTRSSARNLAEAKDNDS